MPHPSEAIPEEENEVEQFLTAPFQMNLPSKRLRTKEIRSVIRGLKNNKSPGYDLITSKVLKELPEKGYKFLTKLFNAILTLGCWPDQLKVATIILILKPGKPPEQASSYRPISLLPILSKVFEKLLLSKLGPIILQNNLLPQHQFGFRVQHSTIEQVYTD